MKKYFLALALLALIATLSGCVQDRDAELEFCRSLDSYSVTCVSKVAADRNDVGVCTNAFGPPTFNLSGENSVKSQDCIRDYVEKTGDITACDLLSLKNINGKETNDYLIEQCQLG